MSSINILQKDQVFKVLECTLDFLEFVVTSMPELLISHIQEVILVLLFLLQNRKENINVKSNDLLNVAQEVMTPDLLLPHMITIMDELGKDSNHLKTKISALEYLNLLIRK